MGIWTSPRVLAVEKLSTHEVEVHLESWIGVSLAYLRRDKKLTHYGNPGERVEEIGGSGRAPTSVMTLSAIPSSPWYVLVESPARVGGGDSYVCHLCIRSSAPIRTGAPRSFAVSGHLSGSLEAEESVPALDGGSSLDTPGNYIPPLAVFFQSLQEIRIFSFRPGITTCKVYAQLRRAVAMMGMGTDGLWGLVSPSIAWRTGRRSYLVAALQLYTSDNHAFAQL